MEVVAQSRAEAPRAEAQRPAGEEAAGAAKPEKVLPEVPGAEPTRPAVPAGAAAAHAGEAGPGRPAAPGRRVVIDPGPPGINPRPPAGCPPARPEATQPLTEDAAAAFVRLNGGGEIRGLKLFEDTVNIRVELDLGAPTAEPEEATSGPSMPEPAVVPELPESEPVADAPDEPQPVVAPTDVPEPVAAPTPSTDEPEEPEPVTIPTPSEPVAAPSPSEASMDGSVVMALATPSDAPEEPVQRFAVGARVEARFEAGETWYAGVIERVDGDAYDVAYDDGDHESNVAAALVREEVVTTRSLDVGPTPVPTSPEPACAGSDAERTRQAPGADDRRRPAAPAAGGAARERGSIERRGRRRARGGRVGWRDGGGAKRNGDADDRRLRRRRLRGLHGNNKTGRADDRRGVEAPGRCVGVARIQALRRPAREDGVDGK